LAGSFFRPLALSYVLAILASLVVAITVTPALSLFLLPGAVERQREAPLSRALKMLYRPVLRWLVASPWLSVGFLVIAFAVTSIVFPLLGEEFLPNFQDRDFLMHWVEKLEGRTAITCSTDCSTPSTRRR
jgi:Cu/Ag efflux pump CusA